VFGGHVVSELAEQLTMPLDPRDLRKLKFFLLNLVPRQLFPLSAVRLGPEPVSFARPTSKLICWSRARRLAVQVLVQKADDSVFGGFPQPDDKWEPRSITERAYNGHLYLYGQSFRLDCMTFNDFRETVCG